MLCMLRSLQPHHTKANNMRMWLFGVQIMCSNLPFKYGARPTLHELQKRMESTIHCRTVKSKLYHKRLQESSPKTIMRSRNKQNPRYYGSGKSH